MTNHARAPSRPLLPRALRWACVVAMLPGLVTPALAQYKVVSPDGSVVYTDRPPPASSNARIVQLGRRAGIEPAANTLAQLPAELRQAAQRYPVTLYTTSDCPPCERARQLLQRRGVPYAERSALTDEDAAMLERIVGGRTVPALMVGTQALRGYAEADWAAYLDAAGYPRESRLPRGWPTPAATPLVERGQLPSASTPAPAPPPQAPAVPSSRPDEPTEPPPGALRF